MMWKMTAPTHQLLKATLRPAVIAAISFLLPGCGQRDATVDHIASLSKSQVADKGVVTALSDIHGVRQRLWEGSDAAATVLVFTLQDCPIANSYIPTLNKLAEEYGPRGIRMLLVHVDPQLTMEAARAHAEEFQIHAPVVIDRQHAWVARAGATRSPEVAVFSPAGDIVYSGRIDDRYAGLGKRRTHVTSHDLREAIEAVLAGRPVSQTKTEAIGCFIPPPGN
jgi:hypothetical protein